ncbi:hypothetical protein CDD83_5921 [Cordyceps sp. RAO-2017]|nr:hypothetical protein CDD83_5921 [Cordyceps sp. RAO-2017]
MARLQRAFFLFCIPGLLAAVGARETEGQWCKAGHSLSLGISVFPGFEPLDVFGPLEVFYALSYHRNVSLAVIAKEKGLVSSRPPFKTGSKNATNGYENALGPRIEATHSFSEAPVLDVLLVPGGRGTSALEQANDTSVEDFIKSTFGQLDFLLSVCTGAVSLAKAGVLSGRRATTNKSVWKAATNHGKNVTWVPTARWVEDGNIWTSSGVSAGIDMTYAFLRRLYGDGDEILKSVMNEIEYAPHTKADWDPFSVVHKVPGANTMASLADSTTPVGYDENS